MALACRILLVEDHEDNAGGGITAVVAAGMFGDGIGLRGEAIRALGWTGNISIC